MIYKNHTNYLYIPDADQKIVKRSIVLDNQFSSEKSIYNTKLETVNNVIFNKLHPKINEEISSISRYIEDNEFNNGNQFDTQISNKERKEFIDNKKLADTPLLENNFKVSFFYL